MAVTAIKPPRKPTGGGGARDEPFFACVTPPCKGESFPELLHGHSVERKADIGAELGVGFSGRFDVVWFRLGAHRVVNAHRPGQVSVGTMPPPESAGRKVQPRGSGRQTGQNVSGRGSSGHQRMVDAKEGSRRWDTSTPRL
jgi:hypothetical protein